jgi:RNA-directed DNA polymerase
MPRTVLAYPSLAIMPVSRSNSHSSRRQRNRRGGGEWEQWHRTTRKAITRQTLVVYGNGLPDETRLVHSSCLRRTTDGQQEPAPLHS